MFLVRSRTLLARLLCALFALWLPAAAGQGGRATNIAISTYAKSIGARPHLSCHGDKKDCCCKGQLSLRAAGCGCHDGETAFGSAAHDPMIGSARWLAGARVAEAQGPLLRFFSSRGRSHDPPDSPPPQHVLFCA